MDKIISASPIMTIAEFREMTGVATRHLNDEEVAKCITDLDLLAEMFVKEQVKRKEDEKEKLQKNGK